MYSDISLKHSTLDTDIFQLLASIRPQWTPANTQLKIFTEGITNTITGMFEIDPQTKKIINEFQAIIIKIFGLNSELFINRENESIAMKQLAKYQLSNEILVKFKNGLIYSYTPGQACDRDMVADLHISELIAKKIAHLHSLTREQLQIEQGLEPFLVSGLKNFLNLLSSDSFAINSYKWSDISSDIVQIENQILPHLAVDLVLCHNDLLCKNIIYDKSNDDISFIDFEYVQYNYWIYDVANHFIEYAGVDNPDFDRYPSREHQHVWLKTYFKYATFLTQKNDKDLDDICDLIDKFAALSHLFWALWAFVQANVSTVNFDYKEYGKMRFQKYLDFRSKLFAT